MKKLAGLLFGLFAFAGLASAQYVGNNSNSGFTGSALMFYAVNTPLTVTGCNTSAPTVVGGPTRGKITTVGTTACTLVLTYTLPALGVNSGNVAPVVNGMFCTVLDITTVATLFTQASSLYTAPTATATGSLSCTFTAATITSGAVLYYQAGAF